ncbi:hypothetical protein [Pararobbsia silviterrae]|uniref:hypothetical protein n=1 Tax=Pararobbsia silviterrae TaxID=1792498 RepID=UPI0013142150|nr:hypothetical protein [Pararobbsia silviterrae]
MQILVIYQAIVSYLKSVREGFEGPYLPMDSDYSYEARQREAARRRNAQASRLLGL